MTYSPGQMSDEDDFTEEDDGASSVAWEGRANRQRKTTTLDSLISKIGKNKFIFDPENGGGRRRKIKKVSRLELLAQEEEVDNSVWPF
jgi:hypothetical protein